MRYMQSEKEKQYNQVFFIVKVLSLFFCAAPLYLYFFKDSTGDALAHTNVMAILISVGIIGVITVMWLVMQSRLAQRPLPAVAEVVMFVGVCCASVLCSGGYASYYKFIFLFLVVVYTMQMGLQVGLILSSAATVFMLGIDIYGYTASGVNVFFQSDVALCAIFFAVALTLGFYVRAEDEHISYLNNMANIDSLTGLCSHRRFHELLNRYCSSTENTRGDLSLLLVDIDCFDMYNDVYGYEKGDRIIREMAEILRAECRMQDIVARFGGDQFVIILPGAKEEQAAVLAEKLRTKVEYHGFDGESAMPDGKLTVSIGAATLRPEEQNAYGILKRVQSALFKAKFLRKNRVEVYTSLLDRLDEGGDFRSYEGLIHIRTLVSVINSRDSYTYDHTERVVWYCDAFAEHLHFSDQERLNLLYAAYLHDVGKINISKQVLISNEPLTDAEWQEMKQHPVDGAEIISQIDGLQDIAAAVRQHHERYDGCGYPDGLSGEEILPAARILALADSFDAMTAERPYKQKLSFEEAFTELRRCAGTQFDPALVEPFIQSVQRAAR
ncbi:MAG: diguanylate cyclase [Candidatus Howiella sp.]|jgi:diguanylate cyclase (GGDEF)-like protein